MRAGRAGALSSNHSKKKTNQRVKKDIGIKSSIGQKPKKTKMTSVSHFPMIQKDDRELMEKYGLEMMSQ